MRALVLAALLALAGCLSPAAPPTAPAAVELDASRGVAIEDPEGDAFEAGPRSLVEAGVCAQVSCEGTPTDAAPTGEPAPYFDVIAARYDGETAAALLFSLEIASIAEDFTDVSAGHPTHRIAAYELCYRPTEDDGRRCMTLEVSARGSSVETAAALTLHAKECNEWAVCAWPIQADVEFGSPATIRWVVPKAYATWDGDPATIGTLAARAWWWAFNPASPSWHTAYSLESSAGAQHQHLATGDLVETADEVAQTAVEVAFALATTAAPLVDAEPLMTLLEGNFHGARSAFDRPELDLLSVDVTEDAGELVTRFTVASLPALPDFDLLYILELGVAGKEVWEIGFITEKQNGAYGYAGHCISYDCAGDFGDEAGDHDMHAHFAEVVTHNLEFGTPGVVEVRTPLALFSTIEAGDVTNFALAISMYDDASVWINQYGDGDRFDWHKMSFVDYRWSGEPHVFREGNAPGAPGHGH